MFLGTKLIYGEAFAPDSSSTNNIIRYDKIQHATVSCLLTLSSQYIIENNSEIVKNDAISYSTATSALVGLSKELHDMKSSKTRFDWGDMFANLVGIGLAVLIINL